MKGPTDRDIERALAALQGQIDADPYCGPEGEYPDEALRADWRLSWTDEPRFILGARHTRIESHRAHWRFALIMTAFGVPAFCRVARCRRLGYCAGSRREKAGLSVGLTGHYPPCYYGFQDIYCAEIQPVVRQVVDEVLGRKRRLYDGPPPDLDEIRQQEG